MLDLIVLIAMAVTAAAFAAGLTLQAGLPLLPVLIGTAALFMVMAASFVLPGRRSGAKAGGARFEEFEEALEIIDADLQRIDRIEDDVARLDSLSDRVERLDQALAEVSPAGLSSGQTRLDDLATEFENVYARIEALRADIDDRAVRSASRDMPPPTFMAAKPEPEIVPAPPVVEVEEEVVVELEETAAPEPELELESIEETPAEPDILTEEIGEPEPAASPLAAMTTGQDFAAQDSTGEAFELSTDTEPPLEAESLVEDVPVAEPAADDLVAGYFEDDVDDDAMLKTVREAVERGRVELHLQPTVTLPDRKVRYFEALTRIRTADDDLVLPGVYIPAAKRAGIMPLIDNVLLVRSVQALRRLSPNSKVERLFCNVSMHSLVDPDYFPELVEFMEENNSLSESLVFEISQPEMHGLTEAELGCLDTLGALGYSFCLDNVTDFDADFASLSDRYFRYVKISAESFLSGPGRTSADLKRDLDGLGVELIIEKVEDEGDVADLLDHGIECAQGYLFGKPKPSDEALSLEREGAGAA